jgi:hypothetical protein
MSLSIKSRGFAVGAVACISLALLLPAHAQFWDWGGRPQRQQQQNNPFGGWFDQRPFQRDRDRDRDRDREAPVDFSHAPGPSQKKPEATTSVVVLGDANADWLAYGLEDAFSEKPEFGVVRKHRTESGLIRYGGRNDAEWPQVAREIIAAEKPKFIVMMIGNNDHQQIREKAPVAKPAAPKAAAQPAQPGAGAPQAAGAAPAAAAAPAAPPPVVDAEQQPPDPAEAPEPPPANLTPEQARQAALGPWDFHSEKWELAYIRRVDATIAALKSAGVPVLWVGLPSQRGTKVSAEQSYLNEIYRSRAEKAGITYVDIWDGFVDEAGRFSPQGPDYEGQIRRLRTGDGVYFTKFGARKLAHYVEREIDRNITNRGMPVALPVTVDPGLLAPNGKPGGPAQRPVAGPVVPLGATTAEREELVGGGRAPRTLTVDPAATRVLVKGEPIAGPNGRADDFSWPRGSAVNAEPAVTDPATSPAPAPVNAPAAATPSGAKGAKPGAATTTPAAGQRPATDALAGPAEPKPEPKPPAQRRVRTNTEGLRPPLSIQGLFR